jgi:hypothetical protein
MFMQLIEGGYGYAWLCFLFTEAAEKPVFRLLLHFPARVPLLGLPVISRYSLQHHFNTGWLFVHARFPHTLSTKIVMGKKLLAT